MSEKFFLDSYDENLLKLLLHLETVVPCSSLQKHPISDDDLICKQYWMKVLREKDESYLGSKENTDSFYYIDMDKTDFTFIKKCFCDGELFHQKKSYSQHLVEYHKIRNLYYVCANCLVNNRKDYMTVVTENGKNFELNIVERHYKKYHVNVNFTYNVNEEEEEEEEQEEEEEEELEDIRASERVEHQTFKKTWSTLEHALYAAISELS